ncbi:hypothetical protein niasHT_023926 [Heterodera trifolii]|uniref:Uncharacterized protein n=1 Tax=Heterodera trifolii TaxID=157864 RepID=A0ABD2JVH1_9BILA
MHFSTINLIYFLIALLNVSPAYLSPCLPIRLTNGTAGGVRVIKLCTSAEKCPENNGTDEATKKGYGIEFRLSQNSGNCDDGLLICYPALLQRGNHLDIAANFKVKRTFTIGDQKDNPITSECAEVMAKIGHKNSSTHWRGIKLRTVPMPKSAAVGATILMEASIASHHSYNFGIKERHFSIVLNGKRTDELITQSFALGNVPPPFVVDERTMQNDFVGSHGSRGAPFLADYAALWLLWLDMLPMMNQQQQQQQNMKLFTSRSHNCAMEAWFFQSIGSIPLIPKYTDQIFPIKFTNSKNQQQVISIKALTDANFKSILVELLNAKSDGSTQTEVSIKIGTDSDFEVAFPGSKSMQGKGVRLPPGSYLLNLDIVLNEHCSIMLKLNGTQFGEFICPTDVKMPLGAISWMKVQGKMQLLAEPLVKQITNKTAFVPTEKFVIRFKNIRMNCSMEIGNACAAGTKLIMLAMSGRASFERRTGARETWMKEAAPGEIQRFFIADPSGGEAADVKHKLEEEQKKHGDIVFLHGFVDKYKHLHLKWFGALTWQQRHCAGVEWVAKVDDDTVVHLRRMDYWINKKFRQIAAEHPLIFFGHMGGSRKPFRNRDSKWCVSREDFPGELFPPFALGNIYLTNTNSVKAVLAHSPKTNGFFLEDVLYSGILAELANVTKSDQQKHFIWMERKYDCVGGVPTVFAMFNAANRDQFGEYFDYLKKLSCKI